MSSRAESTVAPAAINPAAQSIIDDELSNQAESIDESDDQFEPLAPIETAPHPPRDTMTTYPADILPPVKENTYPRSASHGGSIQSGSPSSGQSINASGATSPSARSPVVKSKQLFDTYSHQNMNHNHSVNQSISLGQHSPRRRNSVGTSNVNNTIMPRPSSSSMESPGRSPQMNHGSLLHHEHSTPTLDLAGSSLSNYQSFNQSMHQPMHHSPSNHSPSPSPVTNLPLHSLSASPLTPTTLAATLPSLSARRNSKPLLWSGANTHFKQLLASHTVAELIAAMPRQEVVEIDSSLSPYEGFEILLTNNILAAPVYDATKKEYTGFLDVRDLVSSVIFAHEEQLINAGSPAWSQTWMDVAKKGLTKYEKLGSASITYLSRRSPFRPVSEDQSLMEVARALATRVHRVPVIDEVTKKCVYIVSQSSIINFMIQHKSELGAEWRQSIASLSLGLCKVIRVQSDATAWTSFKLIEVSGVSGIAVVDRDGKLIGNTSAKDLKLFMLDRGTLSLDKDILTYLSQIRQREHIDEVHPSCSVQVTATIGHVIELMAATKYHRVFLTDKEGRPIGVLSLSDVLKFAVSDPASSMNLQAGLAQQHRVTEVTGEHRGSFSASAREGFASLNASPQTTPTVAGSTPTFTL